MNDRLEADDQHTQSSPWPIFVALGITLSELGVLFGIHLISIGGLLLFVGTMAGILRESGYVTRPERTVGVLGVFLLAIGLVLIAMNQTGSTVRGQSITVAGSVSLLAIPLWLYIRE